MNRCLAALLAGLVILSAARAENWPQWRGPTYDGVSKETGLPAKWSATENIVWKLKLPGRGSSTPCIWGDRIFVTSEDGKDLSLFCISTEGKELWKQKLGSGGGRARGGEGDAASLSPSTDGKHVWAMVGTGEMACFDFDGKEIWKFSTRERYGNKGFDYGMHSTPVLYGDHLYIQIIHWKPGMVIAIDKATGKEVWKIERESDGHSECLHSYASPTIWTDGKEARLITHGNDYTIAHSLKDGSEIWRLGDLNPKAKYHNTLRFVSSPVASPDLILVPTAKSYPLIAIKPNVSGKVLAGSKVEEWRYPRTPDVCCPLVQDGLVYLCMDGTIHCVDAKTGEKVYESRVHTGIHRSSPVYADGKVYIPARDGTVSVIKAGRQFEKLASNKRPDEFTASPAISNGRIYLHGFDYLYAISATGK